MTFLSGGGGGGGFQKNVHMTFLVDKIGMCPVARPARLLVMQIQIFSVYRPYNESISRGMNNDNDLNLHSMTKLSG